MIPYSAGDVIFLGCMFLITFAFFFIKKRGYSDMEVNKQATESEINSLKSGKDKRTSNENT